MGNLEEFWHMAVSSLSAGIRERSRVKIHNQKTDETDSTQLQCHVRSTSLANTQVTVSVTDPYPPRLELATGCFWGFTSLLTSLADTVDLSFLVAAVLGRGSPLLF